jgi:hypothetical protein
MSFDTDSPLILEYLGLGQAKIARPGMAEHQASPGSPHPIFDGFTVHIGRIRPEFIIRTEILINDSRLRGY